MVTADPEGRRRADPARASTKACLKPGEGEILADLLIAAHADAKRKLDAAQAELMKDVAGPLAGMPGIPSIAGVLTWPRPPDPRSSG